MILQPPQYEYIETKTCLLRGKEYDKELQDSQYGLIITSLR